ncbi:hypothetical protein [Melittangium boletus]|uniref:HNH nuclease domain-containing protein n=1 Tax=Melittangium boletus DSM 14713 TaxID=1294270 RepID=A0A250I950_9BACT|nr:hypothetical protein [Melittangium boletus]ATB28394.1 hypothetical protein MEBOL_001841 [Melittangium boletus DSM 14713]
MIQLPDISLPPEAETQLLQYQNEINALPDYAARVEQARLRFSALNKKGNPTFDSVKAKLSSMCTGARRCAYCEDSVADEVEHIRPKTLYPEFVFAWMNYLYACGPCNVPKNNNFAVFANGTGVLTQVARRRKDPVAPPVPGNPVLLDPRVEDPTEYMALDLRDTFWFVARAKSDTIEHKRADYTIRTLQLNIRDYLPRARRSAYLDYRAHLSHYVQVRNQAQGEEHLLRLAQEIQTRQHPSVWREMKRQHSQIEELRKLFEAAPEALGW